MFQGGAGAGGGVGEIMLFGVRVKIDPMRKCVSMNNLSEYDPIGGGNEIQKATAVDGGAGYASADDGVVVHLASAGIRERKRGVPWTEEEHKWFLLGLKKVGKGDWRGISKNYVKTRTPTQVASHAQKYFLRQSNANRRRRRSSLFDITTESVVTGNGNGNNPSSPSPSPSPAVVELETKQQQQQQQPISLNLSLSSSSAAAAAAAAEEEEQLYNSFNNSIISVS